MSALFTDHPSRPGFARHLRMTAALRHPGMTSHEQNNVILRCERSEPRRMEVRRVLTVKGHQP
ncbi:hypothetical protein EJV44_09820 [Ancylobacter aquaticus]|nr:hypothetical protein EJV44_09820 [Ancylobacter aquaticus]